MQHHASALETDIGAKSDAQVVVRAVVDVDFVTDVETKANRAETALDSAAGIEHTADIISTEISDAAEESSEGGRRVVDSKIDEAAFSEHEGVKVVVFAQIHLGTKLPVKDAHTGAAESDGTSARVGKLFGESLIKVVARFRFEFDAVKSPDGDAGTDTAIADVGRPQPEIVGKNADL